MLSLVTRTCPASLVQFLQLQLQLRWKGAALSPPPRFWIQRRRPCCLSGARGEDQVRVEDQLVVGVADGGSVGAFADVGFEGDFLESGARAWSRTEPSCRSAYRYRPRPRQVMFGRFGGVAGSGLRSGPQHWPEVSRCPPGPQLRC